MATLIGDVVRSRDGRRPLRAARPAHRGARGRRTTALRPVVPLRITVGDEFQGCFATVGEAVHASLWLRLHLAPAQLRHGIGWGAVAVLADEPRVEDGPGWWAAREAIEAVKARRRPAGHPAAAHGLPPGRRDATGPTPAPVNAALMCRDQMVGSVSQRSLRLLRGVA